MEENIEHFVSSMSNMILELTRLIELSVFNAHRALSEFILADSRHSNDAYNDIVIQRR